MSLLGNNDNNNDNDNDNNHEYKRKVGILMWPGVHRYKRLLKELETKRPSMQVVGPPVKKHYLLHDYECSGGT
jgi:hypothetical protein